MNREFLPEAVLGITVGLLLAVLAVYRTAKAPKAGALARGGMITVLLYAVIASQVLVTDGLTIIGLVLLLVMVCVPVGGMLLAERGAPALTGSAATATRVVVSIGLAAAMLIAAAQTLSMLSLVDPRTLVVVLAAVAGLLVALDGLRASGRIGSLAVWLLIVPILLSLALGFLLGTIGQAVSPIIRTGGVPVATVVCLIVTFVVLGAADGGLAASHRLGGWSPVRVLGAVFLVVILIVVGLLMFFGGAIIAPSVQFFVIPANLNAIPGPAGLILAVLTLLFAALVASALAGLLPVAGESAATPAEPAVAAPARAEVRLVAAGAGAAVLVALVNPGMDWMVIAASLAAAALAVATSERGVRIGLAGAVVLVVVLTLTGTMSWGWWPALAVVAVAAVSRVASGRSAPDPIAQPAAGSVAS